jgi:uncharacterized protein
MADGPLPAAGPLVIVAGLPGTGKTSLAQALARRVRGTYLSSDVVRQELALRGRYDRASIERVYGELLRRAGVAAALGPVVLDATFASQGFRDAAVRTASDARVPWLMMVLRADEAVALARVAGRRGHSEAGEDAYRLLRDAFDPVTLPHLALDSGGSDMEALVDEAEAYVTSRGGITAA